MNRAPDGVGVYPMEMDVGHYVDYSVGLICVKDITMEHYGLQGAALTTLMPTRNNTPHLLSMLPM